MELGQLDKIKSWFGEYVAGFYRDGDDFLNANIELKDKHSRKVAEEMLWLVEKLGLSDNQRRVAEAVGLLHDVGRFPQFEKYRTYNDARSVRHSLLGVEVLTEHKVLTGLNEQEIGWIESAIARHGKKELPLPKCEDADELLFCQLIRDADKIDIYRVVTEYYEQYKLDPDSFKLEIELPDEPWYSNEVLQKVLNGELISHRSLKTWNDCKLLQLSWVYDVNFTATLERLKERGLLEKVVDFLPMTEDIDRVKKKVLEYLDWRIEQC